MASDFEKRLFLNKFRSLGLNSSNKIIVGVDYGTTFTGASFVSSKGKGLDDITVIDIWPGTFRDTTAVVKAPSRIAYPDDNKGTCTRKWGYEVEPGMTACSWTKLLLDQNTALSKYDDPLLEKTSEAGILHLPEGKMATDVVSDYLSEVYVHIIRRIAKQITEDTLRATPLEFWFTVPAIWSDQAQNATIDAARRAGFGSSTTRPNDEIYLINEPEAAAIASLKKYTTKEIGRLVKPGDGVLVCDCGGGTVVYQDLTTYLILKIHPTLAFEELCTGTGGKCGSTAIDREFYRLMSDRFGKVFERLPMKRKRPGSDFMNKFEVIKRDFRLSNGPMDFEIPLNMNAPDANSNHFDSDEQLVLLTRDDLLLIFDPVVKQILALVQQQIQEAQEVARYINRIILVGGFGDSEYLREEFQKSFEPMGISILVPDKPQAAIVQGAALRGLEGLRSTTKKCRRHYGFQWSIPFRKGIDAESNSYIDDFTGVKMVSGIMNWMISKGERYEENYTCKSFIRTMHYWYQRPETSISLYACDLMDAPERIGPDSYLVGVIEMDFSNAELNRFPSKYIRGVLAYHLEYELKVIFGALDGVLKFEASSQGKKIGYTSISFNTIRYY
ncbi:uncharacterized protein GIQ15_04786 [Arthroderma uncinatum]|uniref:uncharacterized protein n=1 Tax=Arthroderma uncinatum TaxID=74035 RepID=UPI00144A668B|nr:uncharacterized protein GIQ15_04786 [Arthroderma uncinatum]KAF3482027.1 hypothetical protein GIQ15_04786 [Arthroderma uncinatum]